MNKSAWRQAEPHQRGRALSAALFLAEVVPSYKRIRDLVFEMLQNTPPDEAEEIVLADRWVPMLSEHNARPVKCFRCGSPQGAWRPLFDLPDGLPDAYAWRYAIPENHVPLCYTCYRAVLGGEVADRPAEWGKAVWGARFDAWERLHRHFEAKDKPQWDKEISPLWPPEFGGQRWESGKGVLSLGRYPSWVRRRQEHILLARTLLHRHPIRRSRQAVSPLWRVVYARNRGRKMP